MDGQQKKQDINGDQASYGETWEWTCQFGEEHEGYCKLEQEVEDEVWGEIGIEVCQFGAGVVDEAGERNAGPEGIIHQ